jgi:uncharacterized alkaline shock family protein YloU
MTSTSSPSTTPTGTDGTVTPIDPGRGTTVINDSVVAKIAGVHALGGGAARALGAIREALSSTDNSQGVSIDVNDGRVSVELTIVAEYPVALQQVAEAARTAVIEAIETLVGLEVTEVNVTINDVHLPAENDENDEAPVQ